MEDPEEQAIQIEIDNISKNIDNILNRLKNLDPAKQEEAMENKD